MKKLVSTILLVFLVLLLVSCNTDEGILVSHPASVLVDEGILVSRSARVFDDDGVQDWVLDFTMRLPEGWDIKNDWDIQYHDSATDKSLALQISDCTILDMNTNLQEKYTDIVKGLGRLAQEQVIIATEDYYHPNGSTGFLISYSMDYEDTGVTYYCDYHVWVDNGLCLYIQFYSLNALEAYQPMFNDIIDSILISPKNV